jgi:hypothetical protein
MKEAAKTTPPLKCPWCHQPADFTIKELTPGKTVRIVAAHTSDSEGPWLRDTVITKPYQQKLLKALAADCASDDAS